MQIDSPNDVTEPIVLAESQPPPAQPQSVPDAQLTSVPQYVALCYSVYCWGQNKFGQLGRGDYYTNKVPKLNKVLSEADVRRVACGPNYSAALTGHATVLLWGHCGRFFDPNNTNSEQLDDGNIKTPRVWHLAPPNELFTNIACGKQFFALATQSGKVFTVGRGDCGQLGIGRIVDYSPIPQLVSGSAPVMLRSIAAGSTHVVAASMNGVLWEWGSSFGDVRGKTKGDAITVPRPIPGIYTGIKFVRVGCGKDFSVALTENGELYSWGTGRFGQLGNGRIHLNESRQEQHQQVVGQLQLMPQPQNVPQAQQQQQQQQQPQPPQTEEVLIPTTTTTTLPLGGEMAPPTGVTELTVEAAEEEEVFYQGCSTPCKIEFFEQGGEEDEDEEDEDDENDENDDDEILASQDMEGMRYRQDEKGDRVSEMDMPPRKRKRAFEGRKQKRRKLRSSNAVIKKKRNVIQFSCGSHHVLCVVETGAPKCGSGVVYGWGRNHKGQLGLGHRETRSVIDTPTKLSILTLPRKRRPAAAVAGQSPLSQSPSTGSEEKRQRQKCTHVGCGKSMSVTVMESGRVYWFGEERGVIYREPQEAKGPSLAGKQVIDFATGDDFSVAMVLEPPPYYTPQQAAAPVPSEPMATVPPELGVQGTSLAAPVSSEQTATVPQELGVQDLEAKKI